jgi:hypothetical protein
MTRVRSKAASLSGCKQPRPLLVPADCWALFGAWYLIAVGRSTVEMHNSFALSGIESERGHD